MRTLEVSHNTCNIYNQAAFCGRDHMVVGLTTIYAIGVRKEPRHIPMEIQTLTLEKLQICNFSNTMGVTSHLSSPPA
jgi:hypothetical protein